MGSQGSKPRKPKHSSHPHHHDGSAPRSSEPDSLAAAEEMQREERQAVLDTMGLGSVPPWVKTAIGIVGVALIVAAILMLIVLD
jgi:hypothetical protein